MLIRMLRDDRGSPDGRAVIQYKKDQEYDIPDPLAIVFIEQLRSAVKVLPKTEIASLVSAPENASVSVENNKTKTEEKPNKRGRRRF